MAPSKTSPLPKNWPPTLPYLTTPTHSQTLTPTHLSALRTPPTDPTTPSIPANTPKGPNPLVKITPLPPSSPHPAAGQAGLFATRDLKPGTFILAYIGEIHASSPAADAGGEEGSRGEADKHSHSDYDLSLDRFHGIGIDADKRGNEARFINDYRGVPGVEKPNAEFREYWDEGRKERGMGVWVLPEGKSGKNRGVKKGDEILVSYGRGFWGARRGGEDVGGS